MPEKKKLWIKENRDDLTISELVTYYDKEARITWCVSWMTICHYQHTNQFCRYPELFEFFREHCNNRFVWNSFHNFISVHRDKSSKFTNDSLLRTLIDVFRENRNIAVAYTDKENICLAETPKFIYQSFEDFRVECIIKAHNTLGLNFNGYGDYLYNYRFHDGSLARNYIVAIP